MSWERTRLDPLEFIQDQNDIWEQENSDEFQFIDTPDFDPDEIL